MDTHNLIPRAGEEGEKRKIKGRGGGRGRRGGEEEVEEGERKEKRRRRMQVNKSVNFVILFHLPVIVADSSLIRARPKSQSFAWPLGGTAVRSTHTTLFPGLPIIPRYCSHTSSPTLPLLCFSVIANQKCLSF